MPALLIITSFKKKKNYCAEEIKLGNTDVLMTLYRKTFTSLQCLFNLNCGKRGGLMVCAKDFGSYDPGSRPGRVPLCSKPEQDTLLS